MANSKKKGNKGERDLCKWWTLWTGLEFSRVPASGGLRWRSAHATSGDIICTERPHDRRFQFTIESKNYKDINFEHLILGNKKVKILEFWDQTLEDAKRSDKIPILFMRYNGMSKGMYFTIMSRALFDIIKAKQAITDSGFDFAFFEVLKYNFVIMNSNDLLPINYMDLHKTLKAHRRNGQKF